MKRILASVLAGVIAVSAVASLPMTAVAVGKGDFNADGVSNTSDVRDMMSSIASNKTITQQQLWWGDYNVNDSIDTADARELLSGLLGGTVRTADYAKPTGEDQWGEKSIALLGDSISFGVGASDPLPENSYVSYVKKAVQAANGGKMNYGFTSAYPTSWQPNNFAHEIHNWPERSNKSDGTTAWICDDNENGHRLTSVGMTSVTPWSTLTYTLRKQYASKYNYFCVYYHMEPGGGLFGVADGNGGEVADINGSKSYIYTDSATQYTNRTAFYRLADCPKDANGLPQIMLCHDGTTKPVTITGIGYYQDISGDTVTFNSYTRGGISLMNMEDVVLRQVAKSDTLILALGYNDFAFNSSRVINGEFTAKIDRLIELCKENGTNVIVNDYLWNNNMNTGSLAYQARTIAQNDLRRFAKETGGIYIDQMALLGQDILNDLNTAGDGIHPSSVGMKMMARNVVSAMGLTWTETW